MARVNILPPEIVSKIAAGEVVERPASVAKEFIENSLDAEADSIELTLKDAGRTLLKIKDNGTGIDADDLQKIFLRHSTSKISSLDDLFKIGSLGFRGEALYSIAAISDISLKTKSEKDDTGWLIHLRGSEQIELKPSSITKGTEIEVKELFFNTPARRKFLKSNTTELKQIVNVFTPYALLHYNKDFKLINNNKTIFELNKHKSIAQRIAKTLNLSEEHIIETYKEIPEENLSLHLLLGDINIQRPRKDLQYIFINNRPVSNRSISFHMNNIYKLLFPEGTHPVFLINLKIPAENIDANIHPTKREVKIKNENVICSILRHFTENTLMTEGKPKQINRVFIDKPISQIADIHKTENKPFQSAPYKSNFNRQVNSTSYPITRKFENPPNERERFAQRLLFDSETHLSEENAISTNKHKDLKTKLISSRFVGNFINKYLIFETENSLILIDQHAAQERINFEKLTIQIESGNIEIQNLLSPLTLSLSKEELITWEETKDSLEKIGFSTTLWKDDNIALHSHPNLITNPEKSLRNILADIETKSFDPESLARRACRSSIMA
ncbi:MAG: DNA mismatch repair endonuclease MutL, partial [Candidatus Omnitrophota bacterium]